MPLADWLAEISQAPNADSLKAVYTEAFKDTQSDAEAQKKIIAAKNARKAAL